MKIELFRADYMGWLELLLQIALEQHTAGR